MTLRTITSALLVVFPFGIVLVMAFILHVPLIPTTTGTRIEVTP